MTSRTFQPAAIERTGLMRNDARPVGEHSPASPVGGDETRPSHIVNEEAEEQGPDQETTASKTEQTRKHPTMGSRGSHR